MYWNNLDFNYSLRLSYKFLYIRFLGILTFNLFKKKDVYFIEFKKKIKQMILLKKIRIILFKRRYSIYNMNVGKRSLRKIKKPNERLVGSIFFCFSHNKLITFVSLFKYKSNHLITTNKYSNDDNDNDINLYLLTKVFNNKNNTIY